MVNPDILLDSESDDSPCYIAVRPESCNLCLNNFNVKVPTFDIKSLQRKFDQFLLTFVRLVSLVRSVIFRCYFRRYSFNGETENKATF